ncbi:hypothetical protein BK127_39405 [Paenibacillus sp. FSL H7-0331]|nr:hypothetical protein BK127_39405 [Paenibacillus sp. FSL H7-0331]
MLVMSNVTEVAHVAKELRVPRQCTHRWITRFGGQCTPGGSPQAPVIDDAEDPRTRDRGTTDDQLERAALTRRHRMSAAPLQVSSRGKPDFEWMKDFSHKKDGIKF